MMSEKRKRNAINLETKLKVIEDVRAKMIYDDIASKYSISNKCTISKIWNDREKLLEKAKNVGIGSVKTIKKIKNGKYDSLDKAVCDWIDQCEANNVPLTQEVIQEKAKTLHEKLGLEGNFVASNGWLQKMAKRFDVKKVTMHGEKKDANQIEFDKWLPEAQKIIRKYKLKDVYNVDETGLFYRLLPNKTYVVKQKNTSYHGGKMDKTRITVAVCVNADGSDKRKLLVIGRYKEPRAIKGIKSLPVNYRNNTSSWMTSALFEEYLRDLNRNMKAQNRKILLITGNFSGHRKKKSDGGGDFKFSNIELLFLPANTTSIGQPVDLGIIKNMKNLYRNLVIKRMLRHLDENQNGNVTIDILTAMELINKALSQIKPETIKNCFLRSKLIDGNEVELNDDIHDTLVANWNSLTERNNDISCTMKEYLEVDEVMQTNEVDTDDRLVEKYRSDVVVDNETSDSEDEATVDKKTVAITEALDSLNKVRHYFYSRNDVSPVTFKEIDKLEAAICEIHSRNKVQSSITNYFDFSSNKK